MITYFIFIRRSLSACTTPLCMKSSQAFSQRLAYLQYKSGCYWILWAIRITEPVSKLRSIELIDSYFGIKHWRRSFYKSARNWLTLKHSAEKAVDDFTKEHFDFNSELVFYDVTTLYFETFQEDKLRKNGFSKNNKSQQPHVLVVLLVTKWKVFQFPTMCVK